MFGEAVIKFAKTVAITPITREIITQLIRAATSVGANYCEADEAESNKEFLYRVSVCKKETKELGLGIWAFVGHWALVIFSGRPGAIPFDPAIRPIRDHSHNPVPANIPATSFRWRRISILAASRRGRNAC